MKRTLLLLTPYIWIALVFSVFYGIVSSREKEILRAEMEKEQLEHIRGLEDLNKIKYAAVEVVAVYDVLAAHSAQNGCHSPECIKACADLIEAVKKMRQAFREGLSPARDQISHNEE